MRKLKIGIIGATGLVGQMFINVLKEEKFFSKVELFLISSEKSAGKRMVVGGEECKIYSLNKSCLDLHLDIAIFSAGDEISKIWAELFCQNGTFVIDNTNAFRKIENVPLVVPEINHELIKNNKIISNPNCSTIELAVVLDLFKDVEDIEQVVVSTYQSVSGAGKKALNDLLHHKNECFAKGINKNVIPVIGDVQSNGFCTEENKIMFELNKILQTKINVYAMSVRVPVPYCHGESVFVKFKNNVNIDLLKKKLSESENVIFDDNDVFVPTECYNSNKTYVCRLKQCSEKEFMFFVVADNLRRGAAFNAFEIMKCVIENNFN